METWQFNMMDSVEALRKSAGLQSQFDFMAIPCNDSIRHTGPKRHFPISLHSEGGGYKVVNTFFEHHNSHRVMNCVKCSEIDPVSPMTSGKSREPCTVSCALFMGHIMQKIQVILWKSHSISLYAPLSSYHKNEQSPSNAIQFSLHIYVNKVNR